jgi:hypothetical protein
MKGTGLRICHGKILSRKPPIFGMIFEHLLAMITFVQVLL